MLYRAALLTIHFEKQISYMIPCYLLLTTDTLTIYEGPIQVQVYKTTQQAIR